MKESDLKEPNNFVIEFAEALDLIDEANEFSAYRYEKYPSDENNVHFTLEVMIDIMDFENDDPEFAVRMRDKHKNIIYFWDYEKFKNRVDMMTEWYEDMQDDKIVFKPGYFDPWIDVTEQNLKDKRNYELMLTEDNLK